MLYTRRLLTVLFSAATLLFGTIPSHAEISPEYYAQYQRDASEALTIKVLKVQNIRTKTADFTSNEICVTARVVGVTRSAKGIQPGQQITIKYHSTERRIPVLGMAEISILKAGTTVPAFLDWDSDLRCYVPAARSHSFSEDLTPLLPRPAKAT